MSSRLIVTYKNGKVESYVDCYFRINPNLSCGHKVFDIMSINPEFRVTTANLHKIKKVEVIKKIIVKTREEREIVFQV